MNYEQRRRAEHHCEMAEQAVVMAAQLGLPYRTIGYYASTGKWRKVHVLYNERECDLRSGAGRGIIEYS